MKNQNKYDVGDLIRVPFLPRKVEESSVWVQDPHGPHVGMVIDKNRNKTICDALVGETLVIKLSTGEIVKLSSNLVEFLD
tara:strand:- start:1535 stop:1774 length:240 start_codon:yes stop_codon:yes gene_type:complete